MVVTQGWTTSKMSEITILMTNGFVGSIKDEYVMPNDGVLYIQGFNVEENSFNFTGIKYVSEGFHRQHSKSELRNGDMLTVQTGDIGVCTVIPKEYEGANCHALIISRFNKLQDSRFFSYYFNSIGRKSLTDIGIGSTMLHINVGHMLNVEVPVPPLPEQLRIAEALTDTDVLISALEKLIDKKRAIKQGTMQELLTGKRRLPGFEGEWVEKALNYYITDFIVPMRDKPKDLGGYIPWCRIEDFNGKYLYSSKSNQGVSMDTVKEMNLKIYPIGTLIVSCSAYLGRCAIIKRELVTNQTFIGLVPNEKADVEYLLYLMCREEQRLNTLSSGTTISYLSREQFEEYSIFMPPTIEEQTAIASILSDMDAEIDALTAKLNKLHNIKQGMMSELLTGRIRLLEEV